MAIDKKRWLLSVIPLVCILWPAAGCRRNPPAEQTAQPAAESQAGTARDAPPATYVQLGEASLRAFETGTEYLLSGRVTSELMEALPGATVSVYGSAPLWSPPTFEQPAPLDTQTCDQDGRYQIRLNAPANLWISIRMEGYAQIEGFVPVRDPKTAARDYQLRPAQSTIAGFVYDKKDMPIAGALVIANSPPFSLLGDSPVPSPIGRVTDSSGKYTIEGLPDGDVSVIAYARGYGLDEELSPLRAGQTQQVNFNLAAAPPISFVVKNSRGEALPYATAAAPAHFKIAGGDRRGVIEFSVPAELPPFECTVAADGYKTNTILLDPKAPPAAVVLEDRPVFRGRVVTEAGKALEGALVIVFGTGGMQGKFDGAIRTDKMGRFSLPLSYPPVREIRISSPGYLDQRLAFDSNKPVPAETVVRVKSVEAGLYGRVIDYRGIPVKRFIVHLRDTAAKPGSREYQRSFSSENGRYMMTDVAPGVYTFIIQSVPNSTAEDVQLLRVEKMEIRKGFFFGEVLSQFPKPTYAK
ncbi:MAG: carboxypeptidase-like regulatory domain-containing protein [Acidobacteriia bacterium]|nr:carboxypeptidase-like regulatory domain-containing protein [Terriglobia bacterium]